MIGTGIKAKPTRSVWTINTTASGMAKGIRSALTVGSGRTYSNERSGENKCGNNMP